MGTSVGTQVFVKFGWRAAAALSMGWYGWQLLVLLIRGPHCERHTWFGYQGGLEARKSVVEARLRAAEGGGAVPEDGDVQEKARESEEEKIASPGADADKDKSGEDTNMIDEKDPSTHV